MSSVKTAPNNLRNSSTPTDIWQGAVAEAIASFLLTFGTAAALAMAWRSSGTVLELALARGALIMGLSVACVSLSGGHINPIVTIAAWVAGQLEHRRAGAYIGAQIVGALIGALFASTALPPDDVANSLLAAPVKAEAVTAGQVFTLELVCAMALCFAFLATLVDPRGNRALGGVVLGALTAGSVLMCAPLSGAGLNPGRTFAATFFSDAQTSLWPYLGAGVVGAVIIGALYKLVWLRSTEH